MTRLMLLPLLCNSRWRWHWLLWSVTDMPIAWVTSMHCMPVACMMLPVCARVAVKMAVWCMTMPCMIAAATNNRSSRRLCCLLLLFTLNTLPYCVKIIAVLLSAARAGVVVLLLQSLVAEETHLVPTRAWVEMPVGVVKLLDTQGAFHRLLQVHVRRK